MKLPSALTIAAIVGCVTGCASPPIGAWDHDTPEAYLGYDFRPNGRCLWIGVEKQAGVGLGSWCSYSYDAATGTITIAEFWDNSNTHYKPEKPLLLRYDQSTHTVVASDGEGKPVVLEWALTLGYPGWR